MAYNIINRRDELSKHALRSELVKEKIEAISTDFDKLWNMSKTARYYDYNLDKELSTLAFNTLDEIKKECI